MPEVNRILHVEDDADIRTIAQIALETVGGYELMQCESGEEALGVAADFAPDLLLLDAMMPGLSGPETLERLRADPRLAEVPAIFMTAKAQPAEVDAFMALGAVGVIIKPFEPMELAARIREILAGAEGGLAAAS